MEAKAAESTPTATEGEAGQVGRMQRVKGSSALLFISVDRQECVCVWEGTFHRFSLFLRKEGERHTLTGRVRGEQNSTSSSSRETERTVHPSVHTSIHPSLHLSFHHYNHQSIYTCIHHHQSSFMCLSIHPSIHSSALPTLSFIHPSSSCLFFVYSFIHQSIHPSGLKPIHPSRCKTFSFENFPSLGFQQCSHTRPDAHQQRCAGLSRICACVTATGGEKK